MENEKKDINLFTRLIHGGHVPDILDCIANLSSDEVFTPPDLVDKILDLFPEEIWRDSTLKWLDPACKTGIFLRQIAKRLMEGLRDEFPNEEERREHIFHNMLYGIALTDLTALMSRRSLYTSKSANSEKSIAEFASPEGNISYDNRPHTYVNGSCKYCGNKEGSELDRDESRERHAYNFIHLTEEEAKNMKFDVIVGNPPYQLSDGGFGASAMPIYQLFVEQAKRLEPHYMAFIIPSRWFTGGKGIDKFRDEMLKDRHVKELVDFPSSSDCFPGVDIPGGVCYFVRDSKYIGKTRIKTYNGETIVNNSERYLDDGNAGIFIRYSQMISVLKKVQSLHEITMDTIISSQKPYGLRTDFFVNPEKYDLPPIFDHENEVHSTSIKIYGLNRGKRIEKYVPIDYPLPSGREYIEGYKIFIPSANGCKAIGEGEPTPVLGSPILAEKFSACTETFLRIGSWNSKEEAKNALTYLKTKFFRFLVGIKKTTQHTSKETYSMVPMLDFHEEWTDEKLFERYDITPEEQDYIKSMIKEM